MRCQCWQRPAAVRRNRSSRVCGRQMDHSFARDDSACVPQAGQGFAVHRICVHTCLCDTTSVSRGMWPLSLAHAQPQANVSRCRMHGYVYRDAASDVSGLSPSSRGVWRTASVVSCALWEWIRSRSAWGVLALLRTELRSHYANTRLYNWCGVMCVGPRTLRVM